MNQPIKKLITTGDAQIDQDKNKWIKTEKQIYKRFNI